jgi:hypothetical protein
MTATITDPLAGLAQVEFKEDGGQWTQWLTETTQTTAYFRGEIDKSYRFQVRAMDNVDNEGVWVESEVVEIATVTKYYTFGGSRACPECNRRVAMQPHLVCGQGLRYTLSTGTIWGVRL